MASRAAGSGCWFRYRIARLEGRAADAGCDLSLFVPTGLYMQESADELLQRLLRAAGLKRRDIAFVVGTGYGGGTRRYELGAVPLFASAHL